MKGEANLDSPVQWITRSALEDGSWEEKVEFLIPFLWWVWPCRCFSSIWRQNITGEYKDFHASDLIATLYYGLGSNSTIVNTTKRTASRWWALDYAAAQAETYVQLSGKSSLLLPLCMLCFLEAQGLVQIEYYCCISVYVLEQVGSCCLKQIKLPSFRQTLIS